MSASASALSDVSEDSNIPGWCLTANVCPRQCCCIHRPHTGQCPQCLMSVEMVVRRRRRDTGIRYLLHLLPSLGWRVTTKDSPGPGPRPPHITQDPLNGFSPRPRRSLTTLSPSLTQTHPGGCCPPSLSWQQNIRKVLRPDIPCPLRLGHHKKSYDCSCSQIKTADTAANTKLRLLLALELLSLFPGRGAVSPPAADGSTLDFIDLGELGPVPSIIVWVWGSQSLVTSHVTPSHNPRIIGMSTTGFTDEPNLPETADNEIISSSDDDDGDKDDSGFNIVHFWWILDTNTKRILWNLKHLIDLREKNILKSFFKNCQFHTLIKRGKISSLFTNHNLNYASRGIDPISINSKLLRQCDKARVTFQILLIFSTLV